MNFTKLTEITGAPGTGKSTLALESSMTKNTLYISQNIPCHSPSNYRSILKRFDNLMELKVFVIKDISAFTETFLIKQIIIDGLDSFLYPYLKPRKLFNDILEMMIVLKRLCFTRDINVIIINCWYNGCLATEHIRYNKYFGVSWLYIPNHRFLVTKRENGIRNVSDGFGNNMDFKITDFGVEFI